MGMDKLCRYGWLFMIIAMAGDIIGMVTGTRKGVSI